MEFAAILGEKMENTNFGGDRRMRKDLGVSIDFKYPIAGSDISTGSTITSACCHIYK